MTGHADPFKVLEYMAREYRVPTPGMTLGRDGALVYHAGRFVYSPGFVVETVDTTGAGDVFHGAFAFAVLAGWEMTRALDFSNAMAALNCTALGARGGIKTRAEAERLMATGARQVNRSYLTEAPCRSEGKSKGKAQKAKRKSESLLRALRRNSREVARHAIAFLETSECQI